MWDNPYFWNYVVKMKHVWFITAIINYIILIFYSTLLDVTFVCSYWFNLNYLKNSIKVVYFLKHSFFRWSYEVVLLEEIFDSFI